MNNILINSMKLIYKRIIPFILFAGLIILSCVNEKHSHDISPKRGEYLVKQSNCSYCHTPTVESNGEIIPDSSRMFSGHPEDAPMPDIPDVDIDSEEWIEFLSTLDNTVWAGDWGITFSANITPDRETGIGKWDRNTFIQTMRQGKHKGIGRNIQPPMPWKDYSKLSDDDLSSIFEYLQTLKPINNKVSKPIIFNKK